MDQQCIGALTIEYNKLYNKYVLDSVREYLDRYEEAETEKGLCFWKFLIHPPYHSLESIKHLTKITYHSKCSMKFPNNIELQNYLPTQLLEFVINFYNTNINWVGTRPTIGEIRSVVVKLL